MKRKSKKKVTMLLIVYLMLGCVFSSSSFRANAEGSSEDSGGFIIESEKVDGVLDLVGIVAGKITIYEGEIYGLTITKKVNRGGNQEPIVIRVKSPGPIPVKQLTASTKGSSIPEFTGLCTPGKPGRICMENVSMTVTAQQAAAITLPNATVETCYASQCGTIAEGGSMSEEELKKLIQQFEDNESTLKDILEGIEKDTAQLPILKDLLDLAKNTFETIDPEQVKSLESLLQSITTTLERADTETINTEELINKTNELWRQEDSYLQVVSPFFERMKNAGVLTDELENNLQGMEETLGNIEAFEEKAKSDKKIQLAKNYAELIQVAKNMKAAEQASDENTQIESTTVRMKLEEYKKMVLPLIKEIRNLQLNMDALGKEKEAIESQTNEAKETIKKQKGIFSEEEIERLLGKLISIPSKLINNGVEKVKDKQDLIQDSKIKEEVKEKVTEVIKQLPKEELTEVKKVINQLPTETLTEVKEVLNHLPTDNLTNEIPLPVIEEIIESMTEEEKEELLEDDENVLELLLEKLNPNNLKDLLKHP
ncbi:hypothetical protein [Robertmurraya kyonggiensis]|uniref:Uncharacterized protein n=1 Tax=Robertmurraya kyonggiensis TaxID=1037680 RepID=A0A4U1DBU1_9BACI|nr:hypothetical protein [Robertmurraya kyonggiensis]TKC19533.1 hypothetical protein FA727_08330 [Robertmurraya kyonggiensis]